MEGKGQTRRCARLRGSLRRVLTTLPGSYYRAYEETKVLAVEADLEKYYDIYEISRSEILEAEEFKDTDAMENSEDTLKAFKTGLPKLYLARKLFFCSLLALGADGGKVDFTRWSNATKTMDILTIEAGKATQDIDEILGPAEGKKILCRLCEANVLRYSHRYAHPNKPENAVESRKRKNPKPSTEAHLTVSRNKRTSG